MAAAGAVLTAPEAAHARLPEESCHAATGLGKRLWHELVNLLQSVNAYLEGCQPSASVAA